MKRLLHIINEVSLGVLLAGLSGIVLVFAGFYYWFSLHGMLVFTYHTELRPSFADAIYFSIVTISSLGYGDIRPESWARLFVGAEVIIGLAFLGLLVAKISSVKQDYILRRMYSEAVDGKLEKYSRELEEQRSSYRITSQLLIRGEIDPELTTTFRRDTPGATFFSSFRQLLCDATDLMVFEAGNGALFGQVDDSRLDSIFESVRGVLRRTIDMWEKDRDAACELVLCDNRPEMTDICDLADKLAKLGRRHSRNKGIVDACAAIAELTKRIRAEVLPNI
jgi:hypothetical protein